MSSLEILPDVDNLVTFHDDDGQCPMVNAMWWLAVAGIMTVPVSNIQACITALC